MNRLEAIIEDRSRLDPCCNCEVERCNRDRKIITIVGNPERMTLCNNLKSSHYQEKIEAIGKER